MLKKILRMRWYGWVAMVAGLAILAGYVGQRSRGGKKHVGQIFAKAALGPLVINLVESGTVKPREQIIIKSRVEGKATILYLIQEGTKVRQGELLVELDTSTIQDNKVNQEITVQNTESSYVQATENLEVVKNQAKADTEKAELTLRFGQEDLKKYKDGEYPKVYKEYVGKITLAEEELQRARDKLKWSEQLFKEKYLSETELRSDQLAQKRCELDVQTTTANLSLLENYTYKRQIDELASNVSQAAMALERIRRSASANIVQAEAQLKARELELNRQKQKLEKLNQQIEMSKIYAPADGLVIYSTSARTSWRGNAEPLAEGQEVFERQELIYLPTADTYIGEIRVHETNLKKIYLGLPVRVRVDALPGQIFMGKITRIAPLPDAQVMFMNPDLKLYATTVEIEGGANVLKSGMNCEAEIIVEQHREVVHVPVQCVVRESGSPVVYVKRSTGGTEKRKVELGNDNNRMIHIVSGLREGEEVLLTPPLEVAVSIRSAEEMLQVDIPERKGAAEAKGGEAAAPAATEEENNGGERRSRREGGTGNLTAEQQKELRERLANMSEEERAALRQRRQVSGGARQGGGGRPERSEAAPAAAQ